VSRRCITLGLPCGGSRDPVPCRVVQWVGEWGRGVGERGKTIRGRGVGHERTLRKTIRAKAINEGGGWPW